MRHCDLACRNATCVVSKRDAIEIRLTAIVAASLQDCTMANGKFNNLACAEGVTQRIGLDPNAVAQCMGDDDEDATHWLLQVAAAQLHACSCTNPLATAPAQLLIT